MANPNLSHRRTHNLLLISKLLNQRDQTTSPFTLVLDTIEQPAKPLVREYIRRANISKCYTIFLAFETLRPPSGVDRFVPCYDNKPEHITQAVGRAVAATGSLDKRFLLLIDSVWMLATYTQQSDDFNLTAFLSSLLLPLRSHLSAQISLVAIYHTDILVDGTTASPYAPTPLSLLSYLATTIITVHSLPILLAEKAARERSLAAPVFGLAEEREGIVVGLKPHVKLSDQEIGIVLELEHRRKSGRGVGEWFFLPRNRNQNQKTIVQAIRETVILLDDHPLFKPQTTAGTSMEDELPATTFELGLTLTERQRREREGVVLPYFDAQKEGGGASSGGRILYDMGVEDDFDEEEDEI